MELALLLPGMEPESSGLCSKYLYLLSCRNGSALECDLAMTTLHSDAYPKDTLYKDLLELQVAFPEAAQTARVANVYVHQ